MLVQDLFSRLSYGELSSLSIGMEGAGGVAAGKEQQILSSAQLALTALYTRFQHRTSFLVLEAMTGVSNYVLDARHAESDITNQTAPRYIKDVTAMDAPFPDDIIRILSVAPVGEGIYLPINARRSPASVAKILAFNEVRLLSAAAGDRFEVEYQAKHPVLEVDGSIQIMPALEEALQARTAAAVFSGMTGEAHVARSAELMARYETLCQTAAINDMAQESGSDEFDKLRDKGFI